MLEVLFIGLSLGSILLLVGWSCDHLWRDGVINMAHGEMVMIGAYVTGADASAQGQIFAAIR